MPPFLGQTKQPLLRLFLVLLSALHCVQAMAFVVPVAIAPHIKVGAGDTALITAGITSTADLTVTASRVESTAGSASLAASGNVTIGSEQQNSSSESHTWGSSSGFLSSSSSDSREAGMESLAIGSVVRAARDVSLFSGGDTALVGSALDAGRNLGIQTRGCKNFCVNGQQAGNCRIVRSDDDRSEERCTQGVAGQPVG